MIDQQVLQRAIEHHQAGHFVRAAEAYQQYLSQDRSNASVWNNFAALAIAQEDWAAALDRASQAISLEPTQAIFHCTRAFALNGLGRWAEAADICRQLVEQLPDCAPAWFCLASASARLGDEEAGVAGYRRALHLKPDYAAAANNLGNLLTNRNDLDGAVAAFRTALQLLPGSAATHNNLGSALKELGRHAEAIACYRQALALDPAMSKAQSNLILTLLCAPEATAGMIAQEGRQWWLQHGSKLCQPSRNFANDRHPDRPLRIGYVSADFRGHPVGRHLLPLLREHDRQQFAVTAYSSVRVPDRLTTRFRETGVQWRDVAHLGDRDLARQITADGIDILVDLSLHTADERLPVFAIQPAPIQISFAGYPGDTGLESIAYHLTDRVLDPPESGHERGSSEAIRLPDSFWCMDAPEDTPEVNALPALSGGPLTLGCLNKFAKVNTQVLKLWSRILNALPTARLEMLCPPGESSRRVEAIFREHGVTPDRVAFTSFLPREAYLAMHGRMDLLLDTFPYNGHMTAMDALWMGVPFVTLAGELPVSRGGASLLTQMGLDDLIARSPDEYVQIAVTLASNLPRLATLRASLRDRMRSSPLMNPQRFARNVEDAYRIVWKRWCAGEKLRTAGQSGPAAMP